jgi:hypothetical protein
MTTYTNISYAAKDISNVASTITTVSSGTVAIASMLVSNTITSPITTSVYITRSAVDYYLVKEATVPVGGSLELIQGSRVVLNTGDALKVVNSVVDSADVWVSALTAV